MHPRVNIRVHSCMVGSLDVIMSDKAVACAIKNLEDLHGEVDAVLIYGAYNDTKKLIESDLSVSCAVEALE